MQQLALISRHLSGEETEQEEDELRKWIEASPEHRNVFEAFRKLWNIISVPEPKTIPDFNHLWVELEKWMVY